MTKGAYQSRNVSIIFDDNNIYIANYILTKTRFFVILIKII